MPAFSFLHTLGRISLEAAVLVLLILAIQALFHRRLDPRWRCALWLIVVVRLLVPISWSTPVSLYNWLPGLFSASPAIAAPVPIVAVADDAAPAPSASVAAPKRAADWPDVIFALWAAGAALLGGRLGWSSLRFQRRLRGEPAVTDPAVLALLAECQGKIETSGRCRILETRAVATPALYGLFRPRLLLPQGFAGQLSVQELRFVLLHELAHLRRRDLPLNWLMVGLQIIHWFNPLVWLGFSRWRADRELACDALALEAAGAEQIKPYGETLLRLLQGMAAPAAAPGMVGISEDPRQLRRRIGMIARFRSGPRWSVLGVALVAWLAVGGLTDAKSQVGAAPAAASPPPAAAAPASERANLVIKIDRDGNYFLGGARYSISDISQRVQNAVAKGGIPKVTISPDNSVPYGKVAALEDALKGFIDRVTLEINKPTGEAPPAPAVVSPAAPTPRYIYHLAPGDLVHIAVFREVTLSTDAHIDGLGNVSLALVGDIHLAGLTVSEARRRVEDAYRATGKLNEPVGVSLSMANYSQREVAITGQVRNPARYLLPPESAMSLVELVTKAGGFTDIANGRQVTIARTDEASGKKHILRVNVLAILRGEGELSADDPSLLLHPGDLVYVPEALK